MRKLLGCLAVLLGAGSVALAARYGYKGADTLVDGSISPVRLESEGIDQRFLAEFTTEHRSGLQDRLRAG